MPRQKASRDQLPRLPVLEAMDALRAALAQGHAVLTSEPGSGKTTLVPLLLRDEPWLHRRRILMLEPRRPAARMAARRMAALLREQVGETVGYQVRFERRIGAATRIEVLTEGVLLRRLQSDPELNDVGLLIYDEFHERSVLTDLSLAIGLDVASGLRDDLRLLAMSASLDAGPLAELMAAQTVTVAGRTHPVAIAHATADVDPRDPVPACVRGLSDVLDRVDGDVLVFLPGQREIARMRGEVNDRWGGGLTVQVLYGELPAPEQDVVLQGRTPGRRVILATDIAETSLTIEGVEAVVDSGLARRPVFDPNTGLSRLQTRWISQASALQRAGRAGRLGPGVAHRAWTTARQQRLERWTPAEILSADLAPLVLELANWGVGTPQGLRWLDPPPAAHWAQAEDLLRQLAAVDDAGRITATGRAMAGVPAHPRLAHVIASATGAGGRGLAADIVALLSERDPLRRGGGPRQADICLRLDLLDRLRSGATLDATGDRGALRQIDRIARQLRGVERTDDKDSDAALTPAACIAQAYPDRVARCTSSDGRRYLMRNGRAALIDEQDPLCGEPFLAVAAVDAGRRDGMIWLAAALGAQELESLFAAQIELRRELRWDSGRDDVVARRVRRLGAIVLEDAAVALQPDDPVTDVLFAQIRAQGLGRFFDDPVELRARVGRMRELDPDGGWPDLSDTALLDDLEQWLLPWIRPGEGVRQLRAVQLDEVLRGRLGWDRVAQLDRWLPSFFDTPAGTRRSIEYQEPGPPSVRVPLQEVLGMTSGPLLAEGRLPLVLHLLSPAGRPLHVTADLAAFWAGAYTEVKKEMRGRYPKHFWPDDPASATATRFTRHRMG